jgi:ASPIC and UnbV
VEKIEVRWPDGSTETIKDIPADRQIVIRQGGGLQSAEKFLPVPRLFKT